MVALVMMAPGRTDAEKVDKTFFISEAPDTYLCWLVYASLSLSSPPKKIQKKRLANTCGRSDGSPAVSLCIAVYSWSFVFNF